MRQAVYIPCDILKPFVSSFVISESAHAASYPVLPGEGIVMGFQYTGSISYTDSAGQHGLSHAGITGMLDGHRVFNNAAHTGTLLVLFSATGAAAFFRQPMHELFDRSQALDDLVLRSQMDMVCEELSAASTNTEKLKAVERFLISQLKREAQDQLVMMAVQLIRQHRGNLKIAQLAAQLHISQGQLEKRFRRVVGATPKKFATITRLRTIIDKSTVNTRFTDAGLEAGYYDQAHFIKDFKSFTGQTPEQFFAPK